MIKAIDQEYIKKFRNGDTEAFEFIYEYYRHPIYFFAYSLVKNAADSEEILQDTFIKVVKGIHGLKDNKAFHPWIYQIAYNVSMNLYNKNKNNIQLKEEINFDEIVSTQQSTKSQFDDKEISRAVKEEIEKLPEKLMLVAMLKYFDGFTVTEIAKITGLPAGTIKTRLVAVRDRIKPVLNDKGYSPKKYLTIIFIPMVSGAFKELMSSNQLSIQASTRIHDALAVTQQSTIVGATVGAGTKISLAIKSLLASAMMFTGIGIYKLLPDNVAKVKEIAYFVEPTNKSIQVEVMLDDKVDKKEIEILYLEENKQTKLEYQLTENKVYFTVSYNGDYQINVGKNEKIITINNIDKTPPNVKNVNYQDGLLSFDVYEGQNEINYNDSYIQFNEQQYDISSSYQVGNDFVGDVYVTLFDNLGNMAQYRIEINEDRQVHILE